MQLVQVLLALMSALLSTCSPHRTCHACLPATCYVLLLPFPRASAICVCAKSHARCPSTSLVLLFPSLPCAPYTTFPHALTLSPLLNVGRGPAPWPDKQLCVAVSSLRKCFKHSCLLCSVLATPAVPALRVCPPLIISFSCLSCALSNTWCVFLLPSRAYAIRVCPTLGCSLSWFPHLGQINATAVSSLPLSSYKPCAPHVLLCSRHGACQSCLPGAQRLIRVAPISHLLCGLLALSSASLHRLVSQSTRNMIDWLGFLFPCAFLYTTNSPVACGVRVCIRATQVCPPLVMSFSCLSHELLPSVSAQSLMRVAPARHYSFSSPRFHVRRTQHSLTHSH